MLSSKAGVLRAAPKRAVEAPSSDRWLSKRTVALHDETPMPNPSFSTRGLRG
jgi:hypothetical protein